MFDREALSARVGDSLVVFVDFLYAVVFGLVLQATFEEVIDSGQLSFWNKAARFTLVVGVFYFLAWDWLHARILTIKHPYTSYRRFFFDIAIACLAYGSALKAIQGNAEFLLYSAGVLLIGALWARRLLQEYPTSSDRREFVIIQQLQTHFALSVVVTYWVRFWLYPGPVGVWLIVLVIFGGWAFVGFYEFCSPRPAALIGGPGPLFPRRNVAKMRAVWIKYRRSSNKENQNV